MYRQYFLYFEEKKLLPERMVDSGMSQVMLPAVMNIIKYLCLMFYLCLNVFPFYIQIFLIMPLNNNQ